MSSLSMLGIRLPNFNSCNTYIFIFLWNHASQLPDIWHRASIWRTVLCNTFLNLRHVHFLFYRTLNIVDIGKFAHKIISVTFTKNFCHIFLWNQRGQLPYIWHRASVWRTVLCNAVLNLRHVHYLFYATLNIVDIGKFAHKIISVTFFSGTTEASFLIFGTKHQYGELYRVTHF